MYFIHILILVFLLSGNGIANSDESEPFMFEPVIISQDSEHSAFTDLIYYNNYFFCSFRESDSHAGDKDGIIHIKKSKTGKKWISCAKIQAEGLDFRDPRLSLTPSGRLMLLMGGSVYKDKELLELLPHVSFSDDGSHWEKPQALKSLKSKWLWDVDWDGKNAYGFAYAKDLKSFTLYKLSEKPLRVYKVQDFHFQKEWGENPTEAKVRFSSDGDLHAVIRLQKNKGLIGCASRPYKDWTWKSVQSHLGGPNFIIDENEEMWVCSRTLFLEDKKKDSSWEDLAYNTIFALTDLGLLRVMTLPSGNGSAGDSGYPGLVLRNGNLYISYYSSHEAGKAKVFFIKVSMKELRKKKSELLTSFITKDGKKMDYILKKLED